MFSFTDCILFLLVGVLLGRIIKGFEVSQKKKRDKENHKRKLEEIMKLRKRALVKKALDRRASQKKIN